MRSAIMRRAVRIQFANESTTNQEFKMRGLLSVVLCLSMAICIMAVDFEMGEHQLGDYLETNRTIYMAPIPSTSMQARINVAVPSDKAITYIKINNLGEGGVTYSDIRNITYNVEVTMTGSPGTGLHVRLEAYAIELH